MATSTARNRGSNVVDLRRRITPSRQRAPAPPDPILVRARSKLASIIRSDEFHEAMRFVMAALTLAGWIAIAWIGVDILEHAIERCEAGQTTAECRAAR